MVLKTKNGICEIVTSHFMTFQIDSKRKQEFMSIFMLGQIQRFLNSDYIVINSPFTIVIYLDVIHHYISVTMEKHKIFIMKNYAFVLTDLHK